MSSTLTRKQITEQVRNELSRKYNNEVAALKSRIRNLEDRLMEERGRSEKYFERVSELQEKVSQYEDWIERLQEYVNMPPDERERALAMYRQQQANIAAEKKLFDSPLMQMYKRFMM